MLTPLTTVLIDRGRRLLVVVRHRMVGLPIVVACTAAALAACTSTRGIPVPASGCTASTSTSTPTSPATWTTGPSRRDSDDDREANDAACRIVSWADLPSRVRSPRSQPKPVAAADNPNIADCRLDNSDLGEITLSSTCPQTLCDYHPAENYFIVHVLLGNELAVDPANYRGDCDFREVRDITIHNYPAVWARDNNTIDQPPACLIGFRTDRNRKAIVRITNRRFPEYDPCALGLLLATRLAPRVDQLPR